MKHKKWKMVLVIGLTILTVGLLLFYAKRMQKWPDEQLPNETTTTPPPEETQEVQKTVVLPQEEDNQLFYQALTILHEDESNRYEEALSYMQQVADAGNADAQYFVGEMFLQGIGTEVDIEKAALYLEQAYQNGNEHAFAIYGKLCFMGDGLLQDYEKAYNAFRNLTTPAAEINCALGMMYVYGMGVRVEYEAARSYLDLAIAAGDVTAQTVKASIDGQTSEHRSTERAIRAETVTIATIDYAAADPKLGELVEAVYTKVAAQEAYETFDAELAAMAKVSPDKALQIAVFGKENWLFFQNNEDGSSYHDYVGDNSFTQEEMAAIQQNLEAQKQKAQAVGAKFVLVIYPNKEIIYADKMPSYIVRESESTRTDQLVAYLRENSEIEIIYPKEKYLELKDTCPLYYATDTHCNMVGCLVGVAELLNQHYQKNIELNLNDFDIHTTTYAGDISVMIGREDRYAFDTVYFWPQHKVPAADKVDESMILVGDSFSAFFKIEADYYFKKGVSHYMVADYNYDYNKAFEQALSQNDADIVVWECAERNVERLK